MTERAAETRVLPDTDETRRLASEVLDRVERGLEADRLAFCRLSGPDEIALVEVRPAGAPGPPPGTVLGFDDVLGSEAVRAGLVIDVDLADQETAFDRALHQSGLRRALRVPVGSESVVVAAIAAVRVRSEPFRPEDIEALSSIAEEAGEAVLGLAVSPG